MVEIAPVRRFASAIACQVLTFALSCTVAPVHAEIANGDWASYNRTLTSERFSPLSAITPANVAALHRICTYDFGRYTNFQTGPIVVRGLLIATTDFDTVALDAGTCALIWRVAEEYKPGWGANRGAAYLDGVVFRGVEDGRVLAYDAATGTQLWDRSIADPMLGELVTAAPIAWQGLVLIGTAGGDTKGVKGRMYALDAATGEVRWEFYLVPKLPMISLAAPKLRRRRN